MRRKKKDHVLNQAPFEVYKTVFSVTRHLIPSIWPQIPGICRFNIAWEASEARVPSATSHPCLGPYCTLLLASCRTTALGEYLVQNLCSNIYAQGVFPSSVLCLSCQSTGVLVHSEPGQQRLIYILYMYLAYSGLFVDRYQLFTTCSRREGTNHKD